MKSSGLKPPDQMSRLTSQSINLAAYQIGSFVLHILTLDDLLFQSFPYDP